MDIADAVRTEYVSFDPSTRVAKLRGAFEDARTSVVVIEGDDGFEGVVSETELLSSHHAPEEKASSVMRDPPRVSATEDVRETARLMVESGLKLLPVFEGSEFRGVVTDRDLLSAVVDNLSVLDVEDVFTRDLVHVGPDDTLGEVIHTVREHSISRVPVVEDGDPLGLISVHDLVSFTVRKMDRQQGGARGTSRAQSGTSAASSGPAGGGGERAGDTARMLDLPARDVMSSPVETVEFDEPLDEATRRILDSDYSSLVVSSPHVEWPLGIVTTTDVLRALTVTEEESIDVQVFGVDLLDTLSREAIAERIEEIDRKYSEMDVLEANVIFHEHQERQRGVPLIQATVRLFTDEGRFSGTAEEYGAGPAFDAAADVVEENALEDKDRKQTRERDRSREEVQRLLGWWMEPE